MSETCDKLMQNAYVNNSFSIQSVNRSLKMEYENSYAYLNRLQKNIIRFEHFHMTTLEKTDITQPYLREFYRDQLLRICTDITHDILDISRKKAYLESPFFEKEISQEDIANHPEIFTRIPILLIDGQVYHDILFRYIDGRTELILVGMEIPFLLKMVDADKGYYIRYDVLASHDIQLLVFDNIKRVYYSYKDLGITLDPTKIQTIKVDGKDGDIYACYITDGVTKKMMCSSIYLFEVESGKIKFQLSGEDLRRFAKTSDVKIYMHYLRDCSKYKFDIDASANEDGKYIADTIVIDGTDDKPFPHPIPNTNMILFKKSTDSGWVIMGDSADTIKQHYPNIYEIIDNDMKAGDKYQLFYFYYDTRKKMDSKANPLFSLNSLGGFQNEYRPMYQFFYDYARDKLRVGTIREAVNMLTHNKVKTFYFSGNDTEVKRKSFIDVFKKLYDYEVPSIDIDITDYSTKYDKGSLNLNKNRDKEPFEYKVEQMWKFIHSDEEVLHRYVIEQNIVGESYYLFENAMDLTGRYRLNSGTDLGDKSITFEEPMYVFMFETQSKQRVPMLPIVFVDGLFQHHIIHESYGFKEFIYVPVASFTTDCMMELEVFPDFNFKEKMHLNNKDEWHEVSLDFPVDVQPTLADFYVTLDPADQKVFADEFWKAKLIMGDLEFDTRKENGENYEVFTPLKHFKIAATIPETFNYGKDFYVNFSKNCATYTVEVKEKGTPKIELPFRMFKPEKEYLRVYKNGRLVDHNLYYLAYKLRPLVVQFYIDCNEGDTLTINVVPYQYKEIYYQKKFDLNKPIFDLSDKITKNFCNRYFDVYVNGRKMSWNSCFAVAPWILTLVNLKSSRNLQIFEIERDDEYFGLDYKTSDRPYSLGDMIKEPFIEPDEIGDIIRDKIDKDKDEDLIIHPNTDEEDDNGDRDDGSLGQLWSYYYGELVPLGFVDPNEYQVNSKKIEQLYPIVNNAYRIDKDVIIHDPNILIEGKDKNTTQAFWYGANELIINK